MKTANVYSSSTKNDLVLQGGNQAWRPLYRVGSIAAIAIPLIVVIQAPLFILYPQPTAILGHFAQLHSNMLLGLLDLDLLLILAEVCAALILLALYAALRRANLSLMTLALDGRTYWLAEYASRPGHATACYCSAIACIFPASTPKRESSSR